MPLAPRNRRVADLARLSRRRREREAQGRFVLDGPVLVADAVRAGLAVDDVFVDPEALDRPEVVAVVAAAAAIGAGTWAVEGGLRGHVDPRTPNGVAAVARIPDAPARRDVAEGDGPALHVVLVAVADPGNVGTLLRTAEAVGATSVVLSDGSVDPWSPKVVRASAGSVLRVPVRSAPADAVLADLAAAGVRRVGTSAARGTLPQALDLSGSVALVLGSEAHGLPADVTLDIDAWVTLAMAGEVESLNVAVAGSVLAYEIVRQRTEAATDNGLVGRPGDGAG